MQWRNRRQSDNVEDMRGMGGRGIALGGGGIGILVLSLVIYLCGGDPQALLDQVLNNPQQTEVQQQQQPENPNAPRDENEQFARVVLADTEDVWNTVLPQQANTALQRTEACSFHRSGFFRVRLCKCGDGTFLLSGRPKTLSRFRIFPRTEKRIQSTRRFRPSLRHRARSRSSRSKSSRNDGQSKSRRKLERYVSSFRIASRLLRRNLRQLRAEKRNFRSRRYRRSPAGGIGGRRRYDPTPYAGNGRSRFIHTRLISTKNRMVCQRFQNRRYAPMQHFRKIRN